MGAEPQSHRSFSGVYVETRRMMVRELALLNYSFIVVKVLWFASQKDNYIHSHTCILV